MLPGAPAAKRGAAAQPPPSVGQVIAGKYALVSVLGEGGMGIVFEATHLKLRQRVALKMLLPQMLEHDIIVTRFEREARAAGQLRNRHVPRVMDVDVTPEGLPYMVMEFLEGHDLQAELSERGRFPLEEAVDYMLQTCAAMMEAHQLGIVHRDLKPANIYLALDGEARIVKVLDFGISKITNEGDAKLTNAESVMGTPMYMSPEQLRSAGTVDARSDIWSLGVILHELLCGSPPWIGTPTQLAAAIVTDDAPDLRTQVEGVPPEIAAIVTKALRRDPRERFDDVRQLAVALAPFAPVTGAGRMFGDALLGGASGMFSRLSIKAPLLEEAPTIVQAAAVSQTRSAGEGTAPGWSQHSQPTGRKRTVLVGFIVAFAVGLVLVGGFAIAWLRWGVGSAGDRAAASAVAPPPSVVPSVPLADLLPPTFDPAPPVTGQGTAAAPPSSAPHLRPRVPVGTSHAAPPPSAKPAAPPVAPPAAPPAKPAPAPAASANPLIL